MNPDSITFSFAFGPVVAYRDVDWDNLLSSTEGNDFFSPYVISKKWTRGKDESPSIIFERKDEINSVEVICSPGKCQYKVDIPDNFNTNRNDAIEFLHQFSKLWKQEICLPGISVFIKDDKGELNLQEVTPSILKDNEEYTIDVTCAPYADTTYSHISRASIKVRLLSGRRVITVGLYSMLRNEALATKDDKFKLSSISTDDITAGDSPFNIFIKQSIHFLSNKFGIELE